MLSGLGDTFGRAIGNADITVFSSINGTSSLSFWMYIEETVVYFLFLVIAFASYPKFIKRDYL